MKFLRIAAAVGLVAWLASPVALTQTGANNNTSETYRLLNLFGEVFERVRGDYVEDVADRKLVEEAINGMLSSLDPHSSFMNAKSFRDMQVQTRGEFGGLGIEVTQENGFVKVVSPIDDTPAAKAGLKPGDLITAIDGEAVTSLTLQEAVEKMRGPVGSAIKLTIRRGTAEPFEVTLTRAVIRVQSVKSKMVEPGYGWVRVSQFQESTTENLVRHVANLYKQGALKGLVLDLRNDPGGLLYGAVAISSAFLSDKLLVVSTDGRTEDAKKKFHASPEDYLRGSRDDVLKGLPAAAKTVPMVVLVNGGSASASEIVAGALQDHKRATVIGTQTFGKGSVQTIMPLGNNTAIKLTTARYYTPSGRSIQAKGITPDVMVEDPSDVSARVREADLTRHLNNPTSPDEKKETRAKPAAPAAPAGETAKPIELGSKDDFQLQQAIAYLKGEPVKQPPSVAATKPAATPTN